MDDLQLWMETYGVMCSKERFQEALTHPSMRVEDYSVRDYEQLETIGDAVLDLLTLEYILERHPKATPAQLTKGRSNIVNNNILGTLGRQIGIHKIIRIPLLYKVVNNDLSNVIEAIFGAIYIDQGMEYCSKFFRKLQPMILELLNKKHGGLDINANHSNPIGALQEFTQKKRLEMPRYIELDQKGPDNDPIFTIKVIVSIHGEKYSAIGIGSSKQIARKRAASDVLSKLTNQLEV